MSTTTLPRSTVDAPSPPGPDAVAAPPTPASPTEGRPSTWRRFVTPRPDDPRWARPALVALLVGTAVLYIWGLGASGWANSFYSAAVQAGTQSWKAFFYGSSDAANSITVDKSPVFLWPMIISARIFGLSSWSILVPQALEGVAAVALLHATVRRWFSPAAALLSGLVLALTPVAALMFRFNNPDAMLVLLLTGGAYAMTRAVEDGRTRWLLLAGSFVGVGFLAKMLQALLVLPAFGLVYLIAGPPKLFKRVWQTFLIGVAAIVSAGWWVAAVELTPAADRPYIGGSQNNSVLNLIFGYNGFGRLTGNEEGSVGGGAAGTTGRWGATGLTRLFDQSFGGQASWLIPAALILMVALVGFTLRNRRTDRIRAAMVLWGGWLVVTGLAISLGQGIIHEYYTVALTPAIGALVGIGSVELWRRRDSLAARATLALVLAATAAWSYVLLARTPDWVSPLRFVVLVGGVAVAIALVAWKGLRGKAAAALATVGIVLALSGPAAYSLDTVTTPHTGSIPTAGPSTGGGFGGGPGGGVPGGGGAFPGGGPAAAGTRPGGTGTAPQGGGTQGGTVQPPQGGTATDGGGRGGGGVGGILGASAPSAELVSVLQDGADAFTWPAATVSSNQAAGYQLATGDPVMAIGGFNGTDPSPTLAQFQQYVADGQIHWFIAGGGGMGGGGGGGTGGATTSESSEITSWVTANFSATTVGTTTLYDLTTPLGG